METELKPERSSKAETSSSRSRSGTRASSRRSSRGGERARRAERSRQWKPTLQPSTNEILRKAQKRNSNNMSKENYNELIESAKSALVSVIVESYKIEHQRRSFLGAIRLSKGNDALITEMDQKCRSISRQLSDMDYEYEELRKLVWKLSKEKESLYGS